VWLRRLISAVLLLSGAAAAVADPGGRPGDYGYRHEDYHQRGLIEELERKAGQSCCDGHGECRATYIDLRERKVYLDGRWCPIGFRTALRFDLELPDQFALVCAGRPRSEGNPCPVVYCVAAALGG
jgi:hypothetical protein